MDAVLRQRAVVILEERDKKKRRAKDGERKEGAGGFRSQREFN
jgi:hypothetical protein